MTTTTADTKLRTKVQAVLKLEAQLDKLAERMTAGITAAWELHQQSEAPSMEAWAAVWAEERKAFDGQLKLAAGVRKSIVQALATEGLSNRAIAAALGIGLGTANRDAEGTERDGSVGADGRKRSNPNSNRKAKAEANTEAEQGPKIDSSNRRVEKAVEVLMGISCRGEHATTLSRLVTAACTLSQAEDTAKPFVELAVALADLAAELAVESEKVAA